jgi:hypothetical protein
MFAHKFTMFFEPYKVNQRAESFYRKTALFLFAGFILPDSNDKKLEDLVCPS